MPKPQTVEWHEECLKNLKLSLEKKVEAVQRAQADHYQLTKAAYALENQIARAKRQGKKSFDSSRYNPMG